MGLENHSISVISVPQAELEKVYTPLSAPVMGGRDVFF